MASREVSWAVSVEKRPLVRLSRTRRAPDEKGEDGRGGESRPSLPFVE